MRVSLLSAILLLLAQGVWAQDRILLRQASLSPDGQELLFSYQGDIWRMSLPDGQPRRLTVHQAYDSKAIWSPDGKQIAFQSDREGNNNIYVMPAQAGRPKQLTYYSGNDQLLGWKDDKTLLFASSRTYIKIERSYGVYEIPVEGGQPQRILNSDAVGAQISPNKEQLLLVRGACRTAREDYRGPANRDLWTYNIKADQFEQITDFKGNDFNGQWIDNQRFCYISAQSGRYNIYLKDLATKKEKSLTQEKKMGILDFSVSRDGQYMVYQQADQIFWGKTEGKKQEIKVEIASDYRFDPFIKKNYSSVENYSPSPNAKRIAYEVHGDIFVGAQHKELTQGRALAQGPSRQRDPIYLNEETVLYRSDETGKYALYSVQSTDTAETDLYRSLKVKTQLVQSFDLDITNYWLSPDRKQLAYLLGVGQLWVAQIDSLGKLSKNKKLLDGWATPSGLSWSPDSYWLAYSLEDLNFNEEIFIHAANDSIPPVNVSMHPRKDHNPAWSPDGSKLAFSSNRNNGDSDIWFVWLKKEDYLRQTTEWKELEIWSEEDEKSPISVAKKVVIDFDQIYARSRQVTAMPGSESGICWAPDNKHIFYLSSANSGKNFEKDRALYTVRWDGKENKEAIPGSQRPYNLQLSADSKYLFSQVSGGKLAYIQLSNQKLTGLSFRSSLEIDYAGVLAQIFDEGWRALEVGFYDPQFHGYNWKKLKETYRPLCLKASTKEDFQWMYNLMLGQLDASHMGLYGGDNPKMLQRKATGLLGLELWQDGKAGAKVRSVLPESPANRPESQILANERILSVNGKRIGAQDNLYAFLEGTSNKRTLLEVQNEAGEVRELVIWPKRSLNNERYEAWVQDRKALTDKYSKGELGYIHIKAMGWSSFERFEQELMAAGHGKKGIVIDVRYNGGGWTTDYLMAVLSVRQHAYTIPRGAAKNLKKEHKDFSDYYPYSERLPLAAWTKGSIALCNESSYSNAEIFSHAYKNLGLGTLVGQPTFGAVISTGGYGLQDGSYVRMPFRAWYTKANDENMERIPAMPDILVRLAPDYQSKQEDQQLKRAVEELLKQLDNSKK
ncbi:S41 family peptidase [Saprospira sp. CCB-QB6]|uniref:S41 family peptidase n=1 Tax=Saprospira sp. CCB-QB6 TaxID=3023936 RepID=UPI00234AE30A|nr:S41 family peptidase [Saprospira sp. CCB-QB6]WCL82154.1 S41 family peptidase [Saprospira sp. CCB-QB6]